MKKWLEKLKSGEKTTIVAFGDSVTKGYFKSGDEFHSEKDESAVYHQILGAKLRYVLPNCNLEVINAGVGGESARMGLIRFESDVADKKPDLCIVCWGLNDVNGTVENYTTNLAEIFTRLKNMGSDIVFMTPNMLNTRYCEETAEMHKEYAKKTAKNQNEGKMDAFMDAAREVCAEYNVPICDCYSKWKKMAELGVDTTLLLDNYINHPTREMHVFFADCLFDTLIFG